MAEDLELKRSSPGHNSLSYEGAGSRIRTDDLLITNQLLYQLSYAGISERSSRPISKIPVIVYAISRS